MRERPLEGRPSGEEDPGGAQALARRVERYLDGWLTRRELPGNLREAARYALLGPGKRTRPVLVLRSCEAVGGDPELALPAAGALEMIHAFSLVHDDLPAMDDDDLRRGRPTLHRHTNEAMAILAGDALMGLALELVLTELRPAELAAGVTREIAIGCNNMIAGQVWDTLPAFEEGLPPLDRLQTIHRNKTGALIRASCRVGALCGGATGDPLDRMTRFGEAIGLMFQVVDDLLDVTQTTQHLGKTAGKDADQHKLTYPALLGIEATRREVNRLRDEALDSLDGLGPAADTLREMCRELAVRTR